MFNLYHTLDYHHQHHQELVDAATHQHLAEIALGGNDQSDPFYYEALAALGRHLSNWGYQLQERYSCPELIPANESSQ